MEVDINKNRAFILGSTKHYKQKAMGGCDKLTKA